MADFVPLDQVSAAPQHDAGFIPLDQIAGPSRLRGLVTGAAEPHTTLGGVVGAVTRGLAPYAAGAAIGAAAGAPLAGVGAIPGAAAGAGAVALSDLAAGISRFGHYLFGTPALPGPRDATDELLDLAGVKRPASGVERTLQSTAAGAGGAAGVVRAADSIANSLVSPVARGTAQALGSSQGTAAAAGAGSGAAQQGAAEAGVGPVGQFVASVVGGAAGGAAAALPAARYAVARNPNALQDQAVQAVIKRIAADAKAGGPTAQDMLDLHNLTPKKPLTLADVGGENVLALAGKMARAPGESRQTVTNALNLRDADAPTRLAADVDQGLGAGSAYTAQKALLQARSAAARPLWEKAMAEPVSMAQARPIQKFITDPVGQEGFSTGLRLLELQDRHEGRLFDPEKYGAVRSQQTGKWIVDPDVLAGKNAPSMPLLQAVKEAWDAAVEDLRVKRGFNSRPTKMEMRLDQNRRDFVEIMRETFPSYRAALDAWSGPSQSIDALNDGAAFARMKPEEIVDRFGKMSDNDKQFFKLGVADTLRTAMAKKGAEADEAKSIVGNQWTRDQLRPLFSSEADYRKFMDSVGAEARMFGTRYRTLGNSATAGRLAEDQIPETENYVRLARGAMDMAHGNLLGTVHHAARLASNLLARPNPELNAAIAKLLTEPLNGGGNALRVLQGFPNAGISRPSPVTQLAVPMLLRALAPPVPALPPPVPAFQQQ